MDTPDGKQRRPNADLSEAALWYLRSKAKHLPTDETQEFANWLRRSPENASALLFIAERVCQAMPRRGATSRFKQAVVNVLRRDRANARPAAKPDALSLSYCRYVKQKHWLPKIGLLGITLGGVGGAMFLHDLRPLRIVAVALACLALLMIREAIVAHRVAKGHFGTTESEVRDFLKFIMTRRADIDFTDQGGKRRPSFVPEPHPPNPAAPRARPGVLSE